MFQFKVQLFVAFLFILGIATLGIRRNSSSLPALDRLVQFKGSLQSVLGGSRTDDIALKSASDEFKTPPQAAPSFDVRADQISPEIRDLITKSRRLNDEVASTSNPRTFDSVIAALAYDEMQLNDIALYSLLKNVSPDKAVRNAVTEPFQEFMDYLVEAVLRPDVYEAVKAVYDAKPLLDYEDDRLLAKMELGYRRSGLLLPVASQEQVKYLQQKMSNISTVFSQNLSEEKGGLWFTKDELDGVPLDLVETWETKKTDDTTFYKMTYKYPDIFPTLRRANLEATRRKAWIGYEAKVPQNVELMVDMLDLRNETASLLGYHSFADYAIEDKMAAQGATASSFLTGLSHKLREAGQKDLDVLKRIKKEHGSSSPFKAWDHSWASRVLIEEEYQVDADKVAEYFEMDHTVREMLAVYETLFSLHFIELGKGDANYNTWHRDVRQFAVWRSDTSSFCGWLYFDMFPREGKYGHAAEFLITPGGLDRQGNRQYPVVALVCNFSKPSKEKPSLLKFDEVVTFFHELGHGIHDLVSHVKWTRFHGTSVVPVS